ncbi:porin [Burkholderia sp. SG-MS1]|uniref:porin n=1 Tax=Paraburkholderia sp. SG-MS1 TaxID=2023741 RepID=UPI001445F503|nr:porin [Paraburkholderia sp. SG-MS1]NKJ48647.1 porin [Paraburkholderia sp. SG-MS1]
MNYRIALCACVTLLGVSPARAQQSDTSSVTLYGLIDQGVEYRNNAAMGKTTADSFRMASGTATSYFGFRGTENLGGGLQAIWDLQGGFAPNNGTSSQGGRLFGRQAYVGLNGDFGRLTFGRQYTMRFFATSPSNPFGTGAQGITTLDNGVANARADNSISYRYIYNGFEAGVNWSFGRDAVAGNSAPATNCPGETTPSKQCREWSVLLKYDNKIWGVATAYERNYGGTSATWGGLTSPDLTDSRFILGGYFHLYKAKLGAGWIKRIDEGIATPRSNLFWVSGTVPVTPFFYIDGMLAQLKYEHSPNKALVEVLRASYHLSKSTFVYLTGEHINNGGTLALSASTITPVVGPPAGGAQISVIAGIRHVF